MKKENPNSGKKTDNKNNKFLNIVVPIIFIVGIILVFGDWFYSVFIQTIIIPVFSKFPNYNSGIGIGIFLLFLCLCPWLFYKGKNRIVYPKRRYYIEAAFFIFYIGYRFLYHDEIIFYSIFHNCWFTYIDEILVFIIMAEFILAYYTHHNKGDQKYENNNEYYPFLEDEPSTLDDFKRENYAEVLIEKILITFAKRNRNEVTYSITKADTKEEVSNKGIPKESDITEVGNSSFVINISESYGYGKSSFFLLLKKQMENYDGKLILFEYRAWLCDSPKKIIGEFFRILSDNLSPFIPDINRKINKYVSLLLEYSSSKSIFPYMLNNILKEQSSILKERESLKNAIKQIDKPIVIIVDDIDRLHDDELMAFLSLLRNTADFPNVFYLLAADIEYIKQVLSRNGVENPDSYFDKFINLEFLLPGYDSELMDKMFEEKLLEIFKQYESKSSENLLKSVRSIFGNKRNWSQMFENIRDMKRFFNVYSLAIDFYIKNNNNTSDFNLGDDIDLSDLFAIELIKYLSEPIYKILRDRDDLILELKQPQFEQEMRCCLKDEYKKIVGKYTGLSKETKKAIKNFVNEKNNGIGVKNQAKEEEKSIKENDDIQTLIGKDKSEYLDESICLLLNFLFPEKLTAKESRLCFPDAYFRYFLYRYKNNQMTVNEANSVFNLDIKEYKKRIQKIFKEGKQDSFIHKIKFIKNDGHTDIDIVPKLFYFIEEACKKMSFEPYLLTAQKEINICGTYNIFSLLFNWYDKSNYNEEEKIAELKTNMNIFILKDEHVNLLFLFLFNLIYFNAKTDGQRLVFSNDGIRKIRSRLFDKWILPICELDVSNNFKWNNEYINKTFVSTSNLIKILYNVDFTGIEDLQKLLKTPSEISNCNLADHPFLQYIKKQSAKKNAEINE